MNLSGLNILVALLPYIIGSALVPLQIVIGLLLLQSPHQGLLKGIAYVGGMTLTRLIQGMAFGLWLGEVVAATGEQGKGPVVSTRLLVLLLLPLALRILWPRRSRTLLDGVSNWLSNYNRPIVIGVSLVFGLLFLQSGLSGLRG